ncbi:MAG: hypothetical protein LBH87_02540, partial [Coriobacteriales bacterium]|nr:hypothetical protein [Coriobacteriales bacterium]
MNGASESGVSASVPASVPTSVTHAAGAPGAKMPQNIRLYPAIDILDGKVVRLRQGDYQQLTVYSDDPVAMAQSFQEKGAEYLHVVDLNAARKDQQNNRSLVLRIASATGLKVQSGGGFRRLADIEEALDNGLDRVVIGSALLKDPEMVNQAVVRYGDQIVAGIDARNGQVAIEGWLETSTVQASDLAKKLAGIGISHFVYTDINRDGLSTGIDT